jgi:predicted GNAT family N-acyltransferase
LGFLSVGEPFDEAGIPHRKMIKYLDQWNNQ